MTNKNYLNGLMANAIHTALRCEIDLAPQRRVYTHGAEVRNRFSGDKCQLNNIELSMYDFVMGANMCMEMGVPCNVSELRKGLDWFRKNNAEAYMILLD